MDTYKILYQGFPTESSGTGWTKAYSVPEAAAVKVDADTITVAPKAVSVLTQTLVTSIIVCEVAGGTAKFGIGLRLASTDVAPEVADTGEYTLFRENSLTGNDSVVLSLGLTLSPGNTIWVRSSIDENIYFTIMGIEIT